MTRDSSACTAWRKSSRSGIGDNINCVEVVAVQGWDVTSGFGDRPGHGVMRKVK